MRYPWPPVWYRSRPHALANDLAILGSRTVEELVDLPLMNDPASLATIDVLVKMAGPAQYTDANLHLLVVSRAVNLSLERGNCDGSCLAYERLATVAGARFGACHNGASIPGPSEEPIVLVVDDDALVRDAIEDPSLDSPLFALYRGAGTAEGDRGMEGPTTGFRQRGRSRHALAVGSLTSTLHLLRSKRRGRQPRSGPIDRWCRMPSLWADALRVP